MQPLANRSAGNYKIMVEQEVELHVDKETQTDSLSLPLKEVHLGEYHNNAGMQKCNWHVAVDFDS